MISTQLTIIISAAFMYKKDVKRLNSSKGFELVLAPYSVGLVHYRRYCGVSSCSSSVLHACITTDIKKFCLAMI